MAQKMHGSTSDAGRVPCIRCFSDGAEIQWDVALPAENRKWLKEGSGLTWNKCVCPNPECGACYFSSDDLTYFIAFRKMPGLKWFGGLRKERPKQKYTRRWLGK